MFSPCSADFKSEESTWVWKRHWGMGQAQAPVCLRRAFAATGLLSFPEPHAVTFLDAAFDVLCAVLAESFWQVMTITQGGGSPPEMRWMMIPVPRKLRENAVHRGLSQCPILVTGFSAAACCSLGCRPREFPTLMRCDLAGSYWCLHRVCHRQCASLLSRCPSLLGYLSRQTEWKE